METRAKQYGFFSMVASGVFLSTMDSSMINIALPHILQSYSSTLAQVEWVILIYLLTISSTLMIWGRVADRYGKGVIYLSGMMIFSTGSLLCYFSPSLHLLIFFRFLQGIGASMMMSTGPAIIRLIVPQDQLGRWIGSLGIATSMGLMSGPLIGGLILHSFNWRAIFLLNLPISLPILFLGSRHLVGSLPKYEKSGSIFDIRSLCLWIVVVTLGIALLNNHSMFFTWVGALGWVCFFSLVFLFFYLEFNSEVPLLPYSLLREKYFRVAMVSATISFCVLFFVLILMPFYFKLVINLSYDKIGYMMMAVPVSLFVVSPISGRLFDRYGAKYLTSIGMLVTSIAIFFLAMIKPSHSLFDIAWRLSLLGCGQSIFLSPNSASVLSRVSSCNAGVTAGLLASCRNLGMLVGVAAVGLIFSHFYSSLTGGDRLIDYQAHNLPHFMQAFKYTLYIASATAFGTSAFSLFRE